MVGSRVQNPTPALKAISREAKSIAGRISAVSHQLHSSALDYLGLKIAIDSTCREFSATHNIPVNCACRNVPAKIDETIALSFFRVLQEALHNVAKHSSATEVEVRLYGEGDQLLMSIRGQFEVLSKPGSGTTIRVYAPTNQHKPA